MKNVFIAIGNSDDKLPQKRWSEFVEEMNCHIESYESERHFFGGSSNWLPWQNVGWMIVCEDDAAAILKNILEVTRKAYQQDSVFWLVGQPEFV